MGRDQRQDHGAGAAQHVPRTPPDRHIRLGVSDATDDPARHRVFDLRASYDAARGGWVAWRSEQNLNDQQGHWVPLGPGPAAEQAYPTAAACLGDAVAAVITEVESDAG